MRVLTVALLALLAASAIAQADTLSIADGTAGYESKLRDCYLRYDGALGENSNGASAGDVRMYPDAGYPDGKGQRHNLVWFDLSSIPAGATIESATFGFYLTRNGSSAPAISDFKLSRVKPGNTWVEGRGTDTTALLGETTFNSRIHDVTGSAARVPWQVAGATGADDIDLTTSVTWNKSAATTEWINLDVKNFVEGWVNGYENNGMLMWGGTGPGGANNYHRIVTKEDTANAALRPYLTVTYTPEPTTLLLLAGSGLVLARRRRRA